MDRDIVKPNDGILLDIPYDTAGISEYKRNVYTREFETKTNRRLHELSTKYPWKTICIIGLGGIGAWTALWFARLRTTSNLVLIEPDYVDLSNLNRTPFSVLDVGDLKIRAVTKMIMDNNPTIEIVPYNDYFNEDLVKVISQENNYAAWGPEQSILFVDCRDNYFDDYHLIEELSKEKRFDFTVLRTAYNGGSITIDFTPVGRPVMGRGGYDAQPSHVLPSALASLLVVAASLNYNEYSENHYSEYGYLYHNPVTFDVTRIIEYIFSGVTLHRMAASGFGDAMNVISQIRSGDYMLRAEEDSEIVLNQGMVDEFIPENDDEIRPIPVKKAEDPDQIVQLT